MGLFGDDEINKAIAEAEAMMTVANRELFRKNFLEGYAESRAFIGLEYTGQLDHFSINLPARLNHATTLENWSKLVGVLAGIMKFFPKTILRHDSYFLKVIGNLYTHCNILGKEKAKKIIRSLILAWQKRINGELAKSTSLNKNYLQFLAGLKGL